MRQLADICEPSADSSQVICGNIAGYLQNLRTMPAECSTDGLPQNVQRRLHSDLRKVYAIPCGLIHLLLLRLDMLEGTVTELKKDVEK